MGAPVPQAAGSASLPGKSFWGGGAADLPAAGASPRHRWYVPLAAVLLRQSSPARDRAGEHLPHIETMADNDPGSSGLLFPPSNAGPAERPGGRRHDHSGGCSRGAVSSRLAILLLTALVAVTAAGCAGRHQAGDRRPPASNEPPPPAAAAEPTLRQLCRDGTTTEEEACSTPAAACSPRPSAAPRSGSTGSSASPTSRTPARSPAARAVDDLHRGGRHRAQGPASASSTTCRTSTGGSTSSSAGTTATISCRDARKGSPSARRCSAWRPRTGGWPGSGIRPPGEWKDRLDFRVGGRLSTAPEVFVQGRLRRNVFLGDRSVWRLRETVFYREPRRLRLDLERRLRLRPAAQAPLPLGDGGDGLGGHRRPGLAFGDGALSEPRDRGRRSPTSSSSAARPATTSTFASTAPAASTGGPSTASGSSAS